MACVGMAPMPSWSVAPSGSELGDMAADAALHLADLAGRVLVRGLVDLDGEVDVVHVDEALAQGPRHRPVELHDDRLRGPDGRVHRRRVPSEQKPCASGEVALTRTTSRGSSRSEQVRDASERKTGT